MELDRDCVFHPNFHLEYTNILLNSFAREHLHRPHGAHVQEQSVWFTEVKQIAQTEDRVTAFGEEKSSLTFRRMPSRSAN